MFVAVCLRTFNEIWAAGDTEEEARAHLWEKVHEYLVDRQAPETSEMSANELEEFFGCWVLDTKEGWGIK
jgi:predicted RNase H-like HicB family nuclease